MTDALSATVRRTLRPIPDYPKPGILFQDITPVLRDAPLFREVIEAMAAPFVGAGITHVVGIEARGFILGGAVATALGAGFVPARKPGKLPWDCVREAYAQALCHRPPSPRAVRQQWCVAMVWRCDGHTGLRDLRYEPWSDLCRIGI